MASSLSRCCRLTKRQLYRGSSIVLNGPRRTFASSPALAIGGPGPLTTLTEEEQMMKDAVASYAAEVVSPKAIEMDNNEKMDVSIIQDLFKQGFMGVEIGSEYGGVGASFMSAILVVGELARADASVSVLCDVHNTLVNTCFLRYGSDELKSKYLGLLAESRLGSFCLSEPASGSDAFALKSKATKVDGGYKLTGSKMWITNGAEADLFIIFANMNPAAGYKGITAFVAEKEWGVEIAKKEQKLGIRASSTCVITFDDLFIPKENLLGREGEGYKIAIEILNEGRIGIAAQMTGIASGAFEKAVKYALNDREQFGKPVGEFQGMQFQFAQAETELEASRLLLYNAARLKEAGMPFVREAAMAKLYSSQMAQRVTSQCIDWMGGVGFTRELGIEKYWRDSKIGSIYEGTSNIQLQTIAKILSKQFKS